MRCWGSIWTAMTGGVGVAACLLGSAALTGCNMPSQPPGHTVSDQQQEAADRWMVESIRDAAINNAVVSQHTLYPYHFQPNSPDLNELGRRDLAALVAHYRTTPGELNVRRGEIPEDLYKARVTAVNKALADAGVDTGRIKIADGLPGGTGTSTETMIQVLQAEAQQGRLTTEGNVSVRNPTQAQPKD